MDSIYNILHEIVELGFVEVAKGSVINAIPPIYNIYIEDHGIHLSRWDVTLQYLMDYSRYHKDSFEGYYFVSIYDGWREYTEPIEPAKRVHVPWESLSAEEKSFHFGYGAAFEPRFQTFQNKSNIYIELPYPILSYNRHVEDTNVLLIPDDEFLQSAFYGFVQQVVGDDIPFHEKISSMMWRGAKSITSQYSYIADSMTNVLEFVGNTTHPRELAVFLSENAEHFELEGIFNASYNTTSIKSMLQYKYLLDIDGAVSSWSAFYWKLYSNSVVIKCPSHWEQWYYKDLVPYVHYIPLENFRPESIHKVYEFCETTPNVCELIANKGAEFVRKLNYEYAVKYYTIH